MGCPFSSVTRPRVGAVDSSVSSGSAGNPIVYHAYNGETVTLTGGVIAIWLRNVDWIKVVEITASNVDRFLLISDHADHNEVAGCTFDTAQVVAGTIQAPTAVTLGQSFAALALSTQDDHRLAVKINGTLALDASFGPFTIQADAPEGAHTITVSGGAGANFGPDDLVLLRDGSGGTYLTEVESTHFGSDLIPLRERVRGIDLESGVATIELVPYVEILGTQLVGSITSRAVSEFIYLTELDEFKGWKKAKFATTMERLSRSRPSDSRWVAALIRWPSTRS